MRWALLIVGGSWAAAGCGEENRTAAAEPSGSWEVVAARRGNRATELLDGAYFTFDAESGELATNFTGDSLKLDYVWRGDRVRTEGGALQADLVVEEHADSVLALSTLVDGTVFQIYLRPRPVLGKEEAQ